METTKILRWTMCAALLVPAPVMAQQTTAAIVGTVTDSSGSVLTGAAVKVTSIETNVAKQARTDDTGNYTLAFLTAGSYKIEVSAQGFTPQQVDKVELQVGQTARVNFAMTVGAMTQSISVRGEAAELQTESATVGTVIDSAKIEELPLNGRNFVQLAQLIPGAQAGTPSSITVRRGRGSIGQSDAAFGSTGLSVNGLRDTANRYYLDGVEFMDGDAFTYAFSPSVDSLAEFKVEASTYSAESGAAPGAQVSLITKSGTNDYHGTIWEFNRNDALTSTYDAIARENLKSARLNRNQFGANLGGPVWLPGLYKGKDKTFFFFNWESGRQALGAVASYRIVPTDAERSGDFRGLTNARTGEPIILKDPLGAGIVNNVIPQSALSPQALAFLGFQPKANTSNGPYNFINTPKSPVGTQDNYTGRIDHNFSSRDVVTGRYILNDTYEAGTPYWGRDERNNLARTQNVSASYVKTISPYLINQARAGWNKMTESEIVTVQVPASILLDKSRQIA